MQTFIYPLVLMGFCGFLFAQEQNGIRASDCVLYPPNTLIKSVWYVPVISMKTDLENWSTDIFLEGKDDSGSYSSINTCVRVAASGNQIKILGYDNPLCGLSNPFHTTNWTVNGDKVIHLLIQGFEESHLLLRLLGYDTQVAFIPITVSWRIKVNSNTEIEFMCHKGCSLYRTYDAVFRITNKPIIFYGLESPLTLSMNLTMSHDGIKESHNIDLPFPLKNHTLHQVNAKETPNEIMITINGEGKHYQVVEEKMFSPEETNLKIRGRYFLYTDPNCTFKDQEDEDNKDDNDDDDGGDDDDDDGVATTTTPDNGDDGKEKPKKNHNIIIDMALKMVINGTLTLV